VSKCLSRLVLDALGHSSGHAVSVSQQTTLSVRAPDFPVYNSRPKSATTSSQAVNVSIRNARADVLRFGAFEADLQTCELRKNGKPVSIPPQPFKVLALLASRAGDLVTREEIQKELWGGDTFVDFEQGLNFCVKRLRAALGDDAERPRYIETLPRRGYRFVAPVEEASDHSTVLAGSQPIAVRTNSTASEASISENGRGQGHPALNELPDAPLTHDANLQATKPYADSAPISASLETKPRRTSRVLAARLLAGLAVAAGLAAALGFAFLHWGRSQRLTEKDTIVLADFINQTGEPVFDDALKQGLTADLQQSTFLNILSDGKISEQLRYMGRPSDARLTPEIAQEVCRREGSKVALFGSISSLGSHYVITLKAVNCQNSDLVDEEQGEADRRENVLTELHGLGEHLRRKLGESLASIQKYDTPLQRTTTSSLEAWQAFGLATRTFNTKGDAPALPLFKRAIELDPNFALAYADLSVMYGNMNEYSLSMENARKAYELRDKVSEFERFSIDSDYYQTTGQLEKEAEVLEAWKQTYPRSLAPYINLGAVDSSLGKLGKALDDDLQGLALNASTARVYANLAIDYMSLDRLSEAETILDEARQRKLDESMLVEDYELSFLRNDNAGMARCLKDALGRPGVEDALLASQSDTEAFHGRIMQARDFSRRAVESALRADAKETAAGWEVDAALREAEFGNPIQAKRAARAALTFAYTKEIQIAAAMALARVGDNTSAQSMVTKLEESFPQDTLLQNYWLPSIRAAMALHQKDAGLAIEYLQVTEPYALGAAPPPFTSGASLYPAYLLGEAHLANRQWAEAATEFQKICDHRGLVWNSPLGALAWLQLGRAYAGSGDRAKSAAAYQKFLDLCRNGDPDAPIYRTAKAELTNLK
jgi:DNA-binding winged helix-turn-helix (wHTH) protein/tetratricopeptide (TPR) repeat protein